MSFLSGSGAAANQAQAYTGQAADQSSAAYDTAMKNAAAAYNTSENQLLNASGSPAANMFVGDQNAVLKPIDKSIGADMLKGDRSIGLLNAGGSRGNLAGLAGLQGASLAGADAPFYKTGIGAYDSTVDAGASAMSALQGAKAGGKSGIWGQGATSASNAYTDAMNSFYSAAKQAAGAAGGMGGGSANSGVSDGGGGYYAAGGGPSLYGSADYDQGSDFAAG